MGFSIQITTVKFTDAKEETLLDLFFNNRHEDERYDIMQKLHQIEGVWALGTIALNGRHEDERFYAMERVVMIGGDAATHVLGEISKKSKHEDERQRARNLLMDT